MRPMAASFRASERMGALSDFKSVVSCVEGAVFIGLAGSI